MTEFGTDLDYTNLISIRASTNDLVVFYPSISKFMYITCTLSSSSPRLPPPLPLNPRIWPCIALGCILPSLLRIGISCKDRRNNLCGISPNRRAEEERTWISNYHGSFINYHVSFTIHHSSFTIHHSPFTIHHSPFTIHHSPFIIRHPFIIPHLPSLIQ